MIVPTRRLKALLFGERLLSSAHVASLVLLNRMNSPRAIDGITKAESTREI